MGRLGRSYLNLGQVVSKSNQTALDEVSNATLQEYLALMSETETPPIFHAWSLVSAAAACLTRRKYFPLGAIKVMPNMYVMLVGPPGVRKSAGISFISGLLEEIPNFRFAPNNTAGRMQGLVSAMNGKKPRGEEAEDKAFADAIESGGFTLNVGIGDDLADDTAHNLNKHALYVAESELSGFIGRNMDDFITFLGDMWDKSGSSKYEYQLKNEIVSVAYPCLNIIGGITPMHITTYLPPQAIGQGFSSRVIMVYEDKAKKIAWPPEIDGESKKEFKTLLEWIFNMEEGAFNYEPEVRDAVVKLYDHNIGIEDVRFLHYAQRRQSHLLKLAMALCALRMDDCVTVADIRDAHIILCATEKRMPEALGEYGLNSAALARARVTEILKASGEPMTQSRIQISAGSDVARVDVGKAIYEMAQDHVIIEVKLRDPAGMIKTGYVWPREVNPFAKHAEVSVDYLLDDGAPRKSGLRTAKQLLAEEAEALPITQAKQVDKTALHAMTEQRELDNAPPPPVEGGVMGRLNRIKELQKGKQNGQAT